MSDPRRMRNLAAEHCDAQRHANSDNTIGVAKNVALREQDGYAARLLRWFGVNQFYCNSFNS